MSDRIKRKLIEVALPLDDINREAAREKSIRHGHPSTLHLWWARRPLAACRAVLFASLVDDPSAHPDRFPTEEEQTTERERLFDIIRDLVKWENSNNSDVLARARAEIVASTNGSPPPVLDPFAGGGSIPLEAQRLGLEAHASDLNPVAVLINKALIEIPPRFAGKPPVTLTTARLATRPGPVPKALPRTSATTAAGCATRPNAASATSTPRSSFPPSAAVAKPRSSPGSGPGPCSAPTPRGMLGRQLMSVVADGHRHRIYLAPSEDQTSVADAADPSWRPGGEMPANPRWFSPPAYGMKGWADLFTNRQLVALTTFSDLVLEARERIRGDVVAALPDDPTPLRDGGHGATAYADAVSVYLAFLISNCADDLSTICTWRSGHGTGATRSTFARQALPMTWDFAEANVFGGATGDLVTTAESLAKVLERLHGSSGHAEQLDVRAGRVGCYLVSTDPPYYDNIGYADLSDFFYVWLRRSVAAVYPEVCSTLLVPKAQELIATPYRFDGDKQAAEGFFENGLGTAFERMHEVQDPDFPMTVYYAFKQAESSVDGVASTGWETMLQALLDAGFMIDGTWPMRSERGGRMISIGTNALATSIVLVCRHRPVGAPMATRREFVDALKAELPDAVRTMQHGNIAPVDLAQASIGPGMAVFSKFSKVLESAGSAMRVRTALELINQVLDDTVAGIDADFDADTRWATTWFEEYGMGEGPYGRAEQLTKSRNTSVLQAVTAGEQAIEIEHLRNDLMRVKFEEQARSTRRKAAAAPQARDADVERTGLPSWRQVVEPHDDVAQGYFEMAQFAADLHQVWREEAEPEYGSPVEFFRRTFITEGMRDLLLTAVKRFTGAGGDPVIKLQTNFGGGKTHSLIALYHLMSGRKATELAGVEQMLSDAGLTLPTEEVRRAVLVGQQLDPSKVYRKPDGTEVRTIWGELAWQLGGAHAYELVAEADRMGVNPGEALTELFHLCSPCLVLIDEWVAYARGIYGVSGLPAGSFDTQMTFAQNLTDAARSVPTALLVATIPASDIETGGEGGKKAQERLENVVGRMEATWRTASTEESFEIVRRRLFKDLSSDQARQRDAVVKAFHELYRGHSGEFPFGCPEADYERRMQAAYPIHPELFDRLFGDWSELERFQRTRGVLRLMAKVIHKLWNNEDPSLLIMPGSIPMHDKDTVDELTRYLPDGWKPVIETDVDGPNSLPYRLDSQNSSTFGRLLAARRVARTVYFGSAPSPQAATRGLDDRHIKLGCVQPGERSPTFGDALRRLADQATYLYRDGARYWYALKPTVTRLAQDRAVQFTADQVDDEIRKRLDTAQSVRGAFVRVHTAPRSPGEVPDEDVARLVILGPEHTHDPKAESNGAHAFAAQLLAERAGGARRCRNMLVFLAADRAGLEDLRQAVRDWLAWTSIDRDQKALGLDEFQIRQVAERVRETNDTVDLRLAGTYQWVLNPTQSREEPTGPIRWDISRLSGSDPLAERVSRKMATDGTLATRFGGSLLRHDLDRVPLWSGDHVSVGQLWDYYCQYLYLPRLVSREVFEKAIEDGVMSLNWMVDGFAYADSHDGERYAGLKAVQRPPAVMSSGLLVKPEVAEPQLAADRQAVSPTPGTDPTGGFPVGGVTGSGGPPGPGGQPGGGMPPPVRGDQPTHYYGRISLESPRWTRTVTDIAEAIVDQLAKAPEAKVTVTIEVEADTPDGFDGNIQRTISENATTLKFDASDFESG